MSVKLLFPIFSVFIFEGPFYFIISVHFVSVKN